MRITSVAMTDYLLLKDSGLTSTSAFYTSDVQIIIGSNGSGKTSWLKQLSSTPPVRSLFGKSGFKSLVVEKDGITYRLESDYSKNSSPHFFFEGDNPENLNVGGTTQIQQELITDSLGITPFIDDLIMNRYVFPKWTASKRKEFIMANNPDQIGFVLTHLRQISSKIKACRSNLARLQSRKILLEQELITDDVMEELKQEKTTVGDELSSFQQHLMNIEVGIRTLGDTSSSFYDMSGVTKTVKSCRYRLAKLSHLERDDQLRQQERDRLIGAVAAVEQQIQSADEEMTKVSLELTDLEVRYRELSPDGDLLIIDGNIERLERERDKLSIGRPAFEISPEELKQRYTELDVLRDNLLYFDTLDVPLLSSKKRQHRERILSSARYKQSAWQMTLSDLQGQYDDLSKRHKLSPKDIPNAPCAKDACPLYSHFFSRFQDTEAQRLSVESRIHRLKRRLQKVEYYIEHCSRYFESSRPYIDRIQNLVSLAQSNTVLHHVLRQMDILSTLRSNPSQITRRLQSEYQAIEQWHRLKSVLSDLDTAYTLKKRHISSESHDTVKLVVSIENLKKSLYELRTGIVEASHKGQRLKASLFEIASFETIKQTMMTIQKHHVHMTHVLADGHEKDRLTFLKQGIEAVRGDRFIRLSDIERTLRAQSSLRDRYQEEVVSQISIIEKELSDLQQIETSLIAIPKESVVYFINGVFEQANRLIESVWTIPLKIDLMSMDDLLNYDFYVTGDSDSRRELGECSEGQTEMISLAINLALRICLGHLNLPIALDEAGRTFDEQHKQNLVLLLKRLLDDQVISQLFLVSHTAVMHEAFSDSETMVIREDNIMLPPVYNLHTEFK